MFRSLYAEAYAAYGLDCIAPEPSQHVCWEKAMRRHSGDRVGLQSESLRNRHPSPLCPPHSLFPADVLARFRVRCNPAVSSIRHSMSQRRKHRLSSFDPAPRSDIPQAMCFADRL